MWYLKVQVLEGTWAYNKGVALLSFQSFKEAELWRNSVPEIRQQDWLDGVDFIIVPAQRIPGRLVLKRIFNLFCSFELNF